MQIIDHRGRLFGLINLVDLAVVLLVLVVAAAAYYRLGGGEDQRHREGGTPLEVLLEVSEVRQPTVDVLREGDIVYDHTTGEVIGEIAAKEVEPYRTPVETAGGEVVMAEVPEHYNVYLTLHSGANDVGGTFRVASYEVKIGNRITLEGPDFSVRGTVMGFEVME